MYLKRKIDDVLERWFANSKRLPLLLKGARQIGKTAAVRHFASAHYEIQAFPDIATSLKF